MHSFAISLLSAALPAIAFAPRVGEQIRIMDAVNGKPIQQAVLWTIDESPTPRGGEFWYSLQMEADDEGCVVLPNAKRNEDEEWCFVDAQGYSPLMIPMGDLSNQVFLTRGQDVEVRMIDVFEQPVAGVQLSWMLGCGHLPDSRNAISNAQGVAILRDISPDREAEWWPSGPGVLADYMYPEWSNDRTQALLRCEPGNVHEGTVLGHNGKPLVGGYVGQPNRHRGPWCRTDADGKFCLFGAESSQLWIRDPNGKDLSVVPGSVPGIARLIDLSRPEEESVQLTIKLAQDEGRNELGSYAGVPIRLVRKADGWSTRARADAAGMVVMAAPVGSYLAIVAGELGSYSRAEFDLDVSAQEGMEHQVKLDLRPAARVILPDNLEGVRVLLATATQQRNVSSELNALRLPSEACVLRYLTPAGLKTYHVKDSDRRNGAEINL